MIADRDVNNATRRRTPLFALYTSNAVSLIGDALMFLAIPWFVLQTTGSITQTGLTAFFSLSAVAVSSLFGPAIVDRLGYLRASVFSDVASMLGVALIPLLYRTVGLPFWALLALVFVAGLLVAPGQTARSALIPDLAQLAHVRLERASAVKDSVVRLSTFVGGPLAGALIVVAGTSNLLWIDAATFAFSAVVIGLLVPARIPLHTTETAAGEAAAETTTVEFEVASAAPIGRIGRMIAGPREGIAFIWREPVMRAIVLVALTTNLLDAGQSGVLAPAFVKQVYGNALIQGGMMAALGGAALVGSMLFGAIGHKFPQRLTLGVGYTLGGALRFFLIVGLASTPALMIASQAVCGFFIGVVNPITSTAMYNRIPTAMRARVLGAITSLVTLGSPLGGLIAGLVAPLIGVEQTMLVFGEIYTCATLSLLINPATKALDQAK
ncbi:MAG TPA: MFS transporter [Ktedonobacterales bacterium]